MTLKNDEKPRYKTNKKYHNQRSEALRRGIEWQLTPQEWWKWWKDSGHWDERGNKIGEYQMCRFGDVGPYSLDNIYCGTSSQNHQEGSNKAAVIVDGRLFESHAEARRCVDNFDFRARYGIGVEREDKKQPVKLFTTRPRLSVTTPMGSFKSINQAAIAHGINREKATRWAHAGLHGFRLA